MPFEGKQLGTLILTRAEPGSVGMSPIGGYLSPCVHEDDWGVIVLQPIGKRSTHHPNLTRSLADGWHRSASTLPLGERVPLGDSGILAFDGDRSFDLARHPSMHGRIERDGPWIINPQQVMNLAATRSLF